MTAVADVFSRPRIDMGSPRAHTLTAFDLGASNANPRTGRSDGILDVSIRGSMANADDRRGTRAYLLGSWLNADGTFSMGVVAVDSVTGKVVDTHRTERAPMPWGSAFHAAERLVVLAP